jgi:Na+/H+ antiporter NhaD/arsenite permease-like protein
MGEHLGLVWALPFAGLLLTIAFAPLLAPKIWHDHYGKLAALWAALLAVPFLIVHRGEAFHAVVHTMLGEYVSFLAILFGLFTVSGGIIVRGQLRGSPTFNTVLLASGTLLASIIGTTGASMLLIRPLLRANAHRNARVHLVVFFIFLVSNIGGSLTPLGDPPLFLGFLQGVPFFWTLRLAAPMLVSSVVLLAVFFLFDWYFARRERTCGNDQTPSGVSLGGSINFLLLAAIVGAVLLSGVWHPGEVPILGVRLPIESLVRDGLIVLVGLLSLYLTATEIRRENRFDWIPMKEVAKLFAAIFVTIVPAIAILQAGEKGALAGLVSAVEQPWEFFWATGLLSSFLDNAPTYLTFFYIAIGKFLPGLPPDQAVAGLTTTFAAHLEAISAGAVFMGANTYIGNAPNFMVKAIAEEYEVPMPSFFGYFFRWSLPILIPIFLLDTYLFRLP